MSLGELRHQTHFWKSLDRDRDPCGLLGTKTCIWGWPTDYYHSKNRQKIDQSCCEIGTFSCSSCWCCHPWFLLQPNSALPQLLMGSLGITHSPRPLACQSPVHTVGNHLTAPCAWSAGSPPTQCHVGAREAAATFLCASILCWEGHWCISTAPGSPLQSLSWFLQKSLALRSPLSSTFTAFGSCSTISTTPLMHRTSWPFTAPGQTW